MAEMNIAGGGHKKGPTAKRAKKLSTRIDLTPMVDLGFLLITFFIFTTTLAKLSTMEINMPYKDPDLVALPPTKVKEPLAMTVLLSSNHRIYYYEGMGADPNRTPHIKSTDFKATNGIRSAIIVKKKMVDSLKHKGLLTAKDEMTVLIKPDTTSSYSDLVSMLDEMSINDVKVYAIVEITPGEQNLIHVAEPAERQ
jgi:biopolymer transport protein ExbD